MMIISLFIAFLMIGMVSFGGGYAMLPLFERIIVIENAWLSRDMFIDMIALSQITPGPIAVNSATFIGYQIAGVSGALLSTLGVMSIPLVLVSIVSKYKTQFLKSQTVQAIFTGLRPALVGLIMASVFSVAQTALLDWMSLILFGIILVVLFKLKWHPIYVILLSGIIGIIVYA